MRLACGRHSVLGREVFSDIGLVVDEPPSLIDSYADGLVLHHPVGRQDQDRDRLIIRSNQIDDGFSRARRIDVMNIDDPAKVWKESQKSLHWHGIATVERSPTSLEETRTEQEELIFHSEILMIGNIAIANFSGSRAMQ